MGIFQRFFKYSLFTSPSNKQKTSRFGHFEAEGAIISAKDEPKMKNQR